MRVRYWVTSSREVTLPDSSAARSSGMVASVTRNFGAARFSWAFSTPARNSTKRVFRITRPPEEEVFVPQPASATWRLSLKEKGPALDQ